MAREKGQDMNALSEQVENAHTFYQKAYEGPPEKDERHAGPEGGAASPLLAAGEEDEGSLGAEQEGYAD